jgi:REP element-mobilizing transposase RayT
MGLTSAITEIETPMLKRQKQFTFQGSEFIKPGEAFGGSLLKGNPKVARPLDSKFPLHLTLRARKSVLRLPKTFHHVQNLIESTAKKYGVQIFEKANVGNHLHMVIKVNPKLWARFIRELTGRIAQVLKDLGIQLSEGFWLYRPHTRIIQGWRSAFHSAVEYVKLNQLEALGHIKRSETKSLKELRAIWADG